MSRCSSASSATASRIVRGMVPLQCRLSRRRPLPQGRGGRSCMPRTARKRGSWPSGSAAAPAALRLSDDMLGLAWGKLLINLNNAVNALSGGRLLEQLRRARLSPRRRRLAARGAATCFAGPGSSRPRSARSGPRLLPCGDRLARLAVPQCVPEGAGRSTPRRARRWPTISPPGARPKSTISTASWSRWPRGSARDAPVNRKIVELIRQAEAGAAAVGRPTRCAARC